jgi:hypothetical protein
VLEVFVAGNFYREVDRIIAAGKIPVNQRHEQDGRIYFDGLLRQFGAAADQFALDYVHVIEWCVLDMLRVPYAIRGAVMTPFMLPRAEGSMLPIDFGVLRVNLANNLRNRNEIFCGHYIVDPLTKKEKFVGIAKDSWNPMFLDAPKLEDRLSLLARWTSAVPAEDAKRCVFGIHNDWIDLHTLREFMLFLSQDIRDKPKREMRPVLTETEEAEAIPVATAEEPQKRPRVPLQVIDNDDDDGAIEMDTAE